MTESVQTPAAHMAEILAKPVQTMTTVAEIGGFSVSHVKRAIRTGELPARHVGRLVRIATPDALAWLGATVDRAAA